MSDYSEMYRWASEHHACGCGQLIRSNAEACQDCRDDREADHGDMIADLEREESLCR